MKIKTEEQKLFRLWKEKQGYTSFISDGIVNETVWNEQKYKITFILKEANWENATIDLCKWLLSGGNNTYWKTWNNIARWTKALLAKDEYLKYVSKADKTFWLSKISFINLKKIGGKGRVVNNLVRSYAKRDNLFLSEQLCLYKPDIIICCGKSRENIADILYKDVLPKENLSSRKQSINGYDYFYYNFPDKDKLTPIISFIHPQQIAGHDLLHRWYEDMIKIGEEFLSKDISTYD